MKNDKERYIKNDAKHEAEETELKIDDMWFVADICEYLGLGGTILGFILLFVGVDLQNISVDKLKPLFSAFWRGAGTAFLTTIVGIFCMLLIKIKARGLEKALIRKRRQ
ncbi:MAG: MotA/TolQ/ExbB proton channel family protein [bacterium]|nr:MotA/TolQ/ExbB proton channel family protein [bacterium]